MLGSRSVSALVGGLAAVVALGAGLAFVATAPDSYDAGIMLTVTERLVEHHSVVVPAQLDPFHLNSPYANYGVGMSLLMAVPYLIAKALHLLAGPVVMLVNPVLFAATTFVLYLLAEALGARARHALLLALLVACGTLLLPYATTGFSEEGTAFGVALGLLGIARAQERPFASGLLVGGGLTLSVLMRPDSILLVAPVLTLAVVWAAGDRLRVLEGLVLAGVPGAATLAWYNAVRFGSPLALGYGNQTAGWNHPIGTGLAGLIWSPGHGLLWFVPLSLIALVSIPWAVRRWPALGAAAVVLLGLRILVYARWYDWSGDVAWGPRYLVGAMPALLPPLLIATTAALRWGPAAIGGLTAVAVASILVNVVGSAVQFGSIPLYPAEAATLQRQGLVWQPGQNFVAFAASPRVESISDQYQFDWRYWPIRAEAAELRCGRRLAGRAAPVVGRVVRLAGRALPAIACPAGYPPS